MTGKGSNQLARFRQGKRLTPGQAILAKCAECMGDYVDGRESCVGNELQTGACPLFPFMPYNPARQKKTDKRIEELGGEGRWLENSENRK